MAQGSRNGSGGPGDAAPIPSRAAAPRGSGVPRTPVSPAAKVFPADAVGPVNTALLAPSASPELLAGVKGLQVKCHVIPTDSF